MPRKARLDAELVRRGQARSREHAAELIAAGRVTVRGMLARKSATAVEIDAPVVVTEDVEDPRWASRGAHKLLGALDVFGESGLSVEGRRCLDAGASTGGFTDVLLRRGAREVVAVDVGYGQLVWALQTDERVRIHDRTNVRALEPTDIDGPVDLVVADLSFISLKLVLPALLACSKPGADLVPMVKPQFEVGKQRLGSGGVVRDPELRAEAVLDVVRFAADAGMGVQGVEASPLPGPSGNVEFFVWLRAGASTEPAVASELVEDAVRRGPQTTGKNGGAGEAPAGTTEHRQGSRS
ncbi:TlyA family rRNA (cytidine-2'-O)-methyltransferase [Saccharopolyspora gloriosae]|uniref:23S rRNA (Cytidine1920-2'-O)/16S rRNA (Cytidine1409-2'-O)-methyltransferase n=1 Tax=Saccharopolyspora gloriosae TaxID=455344 RepID=A0A840NN77_9PSEU|nr:TlyA family RNA methyltransferase [Saccharopolyspora gloriosae]MBB5070729.1 23S rRNA (cytidine1920-2'-O)/16S rRNA (cytidine1409-2'-O)-methyltransferase [Saccharopolyspora gloriosae]